MSRSYRKFPIVKCEKSCKWGKKQANRKVRRYKGDISSGNEYKKVYDSWEICDYQWSEFKEDVISNFESGQKDKAHNVDNFTHPRYYDTLEEALINWKKDYLCK